MKSKTYFYFLLVVISYPSQNRGCKLENVASLSYKKIEMQTKNSFNI